MKYINKINNKLLKINSLITNTLNKSTLSIFSHLMHSFITKASIRVWSLQKEKHIIL